MRYLAAVRVHLTTPESGLAELPIARSRFVECRLKSILGAASECKHWQPQKWIHRFGDLPEGLAAWRRAGLMFVRNQWPE